MKFLVTNDDGIDASGIKYLVDSLQDYGEVCVVAPSQERSGTGHAITTHQPLRLTKVERFPGVESYMVDGTPTDCVKMALQALGYQPDLVVSGINLGANLGTDVLYSGTVAAAIEGVICGFPAMAVSLCGEASFLPTATEYLQRIIFEVRLPMPRDGLLNINVPAIPLNEIRGVQATRLGVRVYNNTFEKRFDPRGLPYYWMGGSPANLHGQEGVDHFAVENGYVSVTPIHFDLTNYGLLNELQTYLDD